MPAILGAALAWSLGEILIAIVVIAACIGIVFVALRVFGITIPGWFVQICWIVAAAVVAILAIRFVMSL
jgi:hypothetical protein